MKRIVAVLISILLLVAAVSCASLGSSYFAGTVGGVYLTSDDYTENTAEVDDSLGEFKSALWMYNSSYKKLKPQETGNKIVFYSDLDNDEAGFDNALVPANYRATTEEEAGFIIIAEETDGVFYNEYVFNSGLRCKVYKAAAELKLYSIKTGELLYTSEKVIGPQPPAQLSVYGSPSSVTYDYPANSAFSAKIKNICDKIAHGKVSKTVVDEVAMAAAGVEVKEKKKEKNVSLLGTWTAKTDYETYTYKFTDRGFALYEYYAEGVLENIAVLPFSYNDETINIDGDEEPYSISGKTLTMDMYSDELEFKQVSKKVSVSDDKSKLYGVWTEKNYYSSLTLGLTKNGFSIFYGTSRGMSDFEADNSSIIFTDDSSRENRFWIIDDALYIEDEGYFGEYEILKFTRETTGGKDNTTLSVLTSRPWDYIGNIDELEETNPEDIFGNTYTFSSNGSFKDVPFHGAKKDATVKGTYTFNNHVIKLSDGRSLTFAYIDSIAIGYSF